MDLGALSILLRVFSAAASNSVSVCSKLARLAPRPRALKTAEGKRRCCWHPRGQADSLEPLCYISSGGLKNKNAMVHGFFNSRKDGRRFYKSLNICFPSVKQASTTALFKDFKSKVSNNILNFNEETSGPKIGFDSSPRITKKKEEKTLAQQLHSEGHPKEPPQKKFPTIDRGF